MTVPALTLNNGVEIPALGFGVFQPPPAETIAAIYALDTVVRGGPEPDRITRDAFDRSFPEA